MKGSGGGELVLTVSVPLTANIIKNGLKQNFGGYVLRAMVLHEFNKPFILEERDVPKIGPRDVLVKVKAAGVGLSMVWFTMGPPYARTTLPRVIGHEIAGIVEEIGEDVQNIKKGEHVVAYSHVTCGNCIYCRTNRENFCDNLRGIVGIVVDGGYAEYVSLPAENFVKIPDDMPFVGASIIGDAIVTPLHVVRERAQVKPLDTVAIVGAGGGVGIHMVQMAKYFGAKVIGIDISDEKLEKVAEVGADAVINAQKGPFNEEIIKFTRGRGVDAIIDTVLTSETLEASLKCLAKRGRLVALTNPRLNVSVCVEPRVHLRNEASILGSRGSTRAELMETVEIVHRGYVKPIVGKTFPLEEAWEALMQIKNGQVVARAVVIP